MQCHESLKTSIKNFTIPIYIQTNWSQIRLDKKKRPVNFCNVSIVNRQYHEFFEGIYKFIS